MVAKVYTIRHGPTNTRYGIRRHNNTLKFNKNNTFIKHESYTSHVVIFKNKTDAEKTANSVSTHIEKYGKQPMSDNLCVFTYDKITCFGFEHDLFIEDVAVKSILHECKKYNLGIVYVSDIQPDLEMENEIVTSYIAPPEDTNIVIRTNALDDLLSNQM